MKLCLTVNSSPWSRFKGGGQIAVHHLACALARRGHAVHVIYSKRPDESFACPDTPYRIHWVRHYDFATVNLNIFSYGRELQRLAAAEKFDVIHGNAEEAFFAPGIAREAGSAFVFTSHAPYIPPTGMGLGILRHPLFFLKNVNFYLLRSAADGAATIVTFSRFSKKLVLDGLGADRDGRVHVVAPGVDASWFRIVRRPPASEKRFLFWGRLENEKGLPELIGAFGEIAQREPQARLTLVGEGNAEKECRRRVAELNLSAKIDFAGWQDIAAIQNLVTHSVAGVFPSRIESFGLMVAEAQAAGLPVIATYAGALPEIVDSYGTLVNSGDVPALARAMLAVLRDPDRHESLARAGRETARQKYSWDTAAQTLAAIYQGLLDKLRPPSSLASGTIKRQ